MTEPAPPRRAILVHGVVGLVLTGAYLAVVIPLAARRMLWFDELFTLRAARSTDLWSWLSTGADPNPPLMYLAARLGLAVTGSERLGPRFPAILGVWTFCVSLWVFAARRVGPAVAWLAALAPLVTDVLPYAAEGRPYGLLLGETGLALIAWQAAADGRRRGPALIGFAAALMAALSTHYYAVLLWFAFGLAELTRWLERRRPDAGTLAVMLITPLTLVAYRPLLAQARRLGGSFWARPDLMGIVRFYETFFTDSLPALVGMAILVLIALALVGHGRVETVNARRPPAHELILAAAFLGLPVAGVLLGRLATGAFTERYALAASAGFSLGLAWAVSTFADRRPGVTAALIAVLIVGFLVDGARLVKWAGDLSREEARTVVALLELTHTGDLPIVATDPVQFLQTVHHAPEGLRRRLTYVVPPGAPNTAEIGLADLARREPLRVVGAAEFLRRHPAFFAYRRFDNDALPHFPNEWLVRLSEERATMTVLRWDSDFVLLRVVINRPHDGDRF